MGYSYRYEEVRQAFIDKSGFNPFIDYVKRWFVKVDPESVSALFPKCVIVITGFGEDEGDIWRVAYQHGEAFWKWSLDLDDIPMPDLTDRL